MEIHDPAILRRLVVRAMPESETPALDLTCAECGRSPRRGELWRVYFADLGEAVTYCPSARSASSAR
jgi:hypothetical protein